MVLANLFFLNSEKVSNEKQSKLEILFVTSSFWFKCKLDVSFKGKNIEEKTIY